MHRRDGEQGHARTLRGVPDAGVDGRGVAAARSSLCIQNLGLFRNKAKSLAGMAAALMERHDGEVPTSMEELTALPGVGRKTANVVRSVAFDLPGLPVDTHVGRISRLLGSDATRATRSRSSTNSAPCCRRPTGARFRCG